MKKPSPRQGRAVQAGSRTPASALLAEAAPLSGALPDPEGSPVALLVEDEALIAMPMVDILEDAGFLVVSVGTVRKARLALRAEQGFALVVLDSGLPDGDGTCLVPEIRARFPRARILVTSGKVDIALDGVTVLPKPFDFARFEAAVRARDA